jgi:hypothetical protein
MNSVINALKQAVGSYRGEGVNHEGENFIGTFILNEVLDGIGLEIKFEASSLTKSSLKFHAEHSIVAPNEANGVSLFNLNTNMPFLAEHRCIEESSKGQIIFRYGDPANRSSFRQEVHLIIMDSSIRYEYHWGMPGGDFAYRSGATMANIALD